MVGPKPGGGDLNLVGGTWWWDLNLVVGPGGGTWWWDLNLVVGPGGGTWWWDLDLVVGPRPGGGT